MTKPKYTLMGDDINTLVCDSFSDAYVQLYDYIAAQESPVESRLGATREVLNFKTVILKPTSRCTVAAKRNCNIFFHLAESLWVLAGRNDLAFIAMFNSEFKNSSDDGKTIHGAYGKRLRHGGSDDLERPGDQFYTLCKRLHITPDLRRLVISLWDGRLDLDKAYKDVPCNTQLMFRMSNDELHTTVINRSNDIHWGLIANIFEFSMLSEIMALIIGKKFVRQTHFSHSLHFYLTNDLNEKLKPSDIHLEFQQRYPASDLIFPFKYTTTEFSARFDQIDWVVKSLPEAIMKFAEEDQTLEEAINAAEDYRNFGPSFFDIARLLFLNVSYQKELAKNGETVRLTYLQHLKDLEPAFRHKDFWAMAMNYFLARTKKSEAIAEYSILDVNLGNY